MPDLMVTLGPLALRNPILSASGTYGHGLEMQHFSPPAAMGGLVSKTVTLLPRPGNPQPRIAETEAGLLNSIGLENRGVEHYIEHILPEMEVADTCVVTNIGGESVQDFVAVAERLEGERAVDAYEVNLSCPNVQGGRLPFGTDPHNAAAVIAALRRVTKRPLFAKLSPNVTRISEMAVAVEEAGADGVTAVNTLLGMSIDWRRRKPRLATGIGGYSGVGIQPVALRCAWECARAVSIPVIGCGGISSAEHVLEFLVAGCRAVQLGTASYSDPSLPLRVIEDLDHLLQETGCQQLRDLIGTLDCGNVPAAHPEAPKRSTRLGSGARD